MLFTKIFSFKIMPFTENVTFKIALFRNNFFFKIALCRKTSFFKIKLPKYARNLQSLGILRGILNQNVIFCVQIIFQNLLLEIIFLLKIVRFKNVFFFFKIRRIVKVLIQNLTLCKLSIQNLTRWKNFHLECDTLWIHCFKIWQEFKFIASKSHFN